MIDGLQYPNWSGKIFRQMKEGGVNAAHTTIAYHEDFRETVGNICTWNRRFERHADLIVHGRTAADIEAARVAGRTAIFFGFQNPLPVAEDIGLIEVFHTLGVRFMQLTYNNQSALASGYLESRDSGISRMGVEYIRELNRVGIAIDMSHSGERSTLEAIAVSAKPITVSHANPDWWRCTQRNKSWEVMRSLAETKGMLGFSLYPHHLKHGSDCSLDEFCQMIADVAGRLGTEFLGLGSDLCQDQPDSVVRWMRNGRWTQSRSDLDNDAAFPRQPTWFRDNRDFVHIADGLRRVGFQTDEINGIMGLNWLRYMRRLFDAVP